MEWRESPWVKAVRALFARAKASAPSVIFLDELDGLVGQRSSGAQGGEPSVHDRLLTQLLGEMDGLQTSPSSSSSSSSSGGGGGGGGKGLNKNDGVAVVAATNRPDLVDPALLRPGRFDRLLFIPPPATSEDRLEILKASRSVHSHHHNTPHHTTTHTHNMHALIRCCFN